MYFSQYSLNGSQKITQMNYFWQMDNLLSHETSGRSCEWQWSDTTEGHKCPTFNGNSFFDK